MAKLVRQYFSANGSFVCPAGVTKVMLIGQGGGQGGTNGNTLTGIRQIGGYGTVPYLVEVQVVPNTTYSVTIGLGGVGGTPVGAVGGDTSFGSLYTFPGARSTTAVNMTGFVAQIAMNRDTRNWRYSGYVQSNTFVDGGISSGTYLGGSPGSPGYYGSTVGTGGNGNNAGAGTAGGNASGFGAGGGAGGCGSTSGGPGGTGAPGQLWVVWIE